MSWKQQNGKWSLSLGHRGARVRVFQRVPNGPFYRDVWQDGAKNRKSLQTSDRKVAEQRGRMLLVALLQPPAPAGPPTGPLTLGDLWKRFSTQCAAWADNAASGQRDDRRRATMLQKLLGETRSVASLTPDDCGHYASKRKAGGGGRPVRQRTAQADLLLLKQMTRWAAQVKLLDHDPLAGTPIAREPDLRRPVACKHRFVATRDVLRRWQQAQDSRIRARGWLIETALVLAYRTGRRLGAIQHLQWEDVNLAAGDVVWRAESDKTRRTDVRPLPRDVVEQLRALREEFPDKRGYIFGDPYNRHWFHDWLVAAEEEANLEKLEGSTWHAYRRRWASDRAALSLKGVMEYGGWKDMRTVLGYMHLDREQLLSIVETGTETGTQQGAPPAAGAPSPIRTTT